MNEELKKFLLAIAKMIGMDDSAASKLLKDDGTPEDGALVKLQDMDKARIKELRDQATYEHDKGYKKGKGEALASLEDSLKTKFSITASDKKGMELIEEIVASAATKADGKEITDEQVRRHPAYIKLQVDKDKEIALKTKELQDKLDQTVTNTQKQEKWNKVKAKALAEFKELKPVEVENAQVAETHLNLFLTELEKEYEWDVDAKGAITIKKDGELLTDDHSHVMPFKDLIKNTAAKYYVFKAADDRSSGGGAGGSGGAGGGAGKLDLKTPANADEYMASMKAISKHPTLSDEDKAKAKDELTTKWQETKSKMT